MISLFKATTAGDDWGNIADTLEPTGNYVYIAFLLYVAVLYFAILNIVTGIFVQNADKASSRDLLNVQREKDEQDNEILKNCFEIISEGENTISSKKFMAKY